MKFTVDGVGLRPFDTEAERLCDQQAGKVIDIKRVTKAKKRSIEANNKYWAWCNQIERETGNDPGWAHRWHKYRFGVAILRERYPEQIARVREIMVGLTEEKRLEMMDIMPCSSLFRVSEMTMFMDTVQRHWAGEGIVLD